MSFMKHPILGDKLYARRQPSDSVWPDRQMLHAAKLSISHPNTRERLCFAPPMPADMEAVLGKLRSTLDRDTLKKRTPRAF